MKKLNAYSIFVHIFAVVGVVALVALPAVMDGSNKLNSQITELNNKVDAANDAVALYDKTLCSNDFGIVSAERNTKYSISIDGTERTYYTHTPKDYDPGVRYPVVMNFDGISGSGLGMQRYSGLNNLPAISIYPDPLVGKSGFTAWQGAPYSLDGDGDVRFVKSIVESLSGNYCIDSTKVFAVGMSNGGGFAMILACELPQYISAAVGVSGAYYTECNSGGRDVPVMAVHSVTDTAVPFYGSKQRGLPPVTEWYKRQAIERECKKEASVSVGRDVTQYTYYGCKDESMVRMAVVDEGSHGWFAMPSSYQKATRYHDGSMASYVWGFLSESAS